MDQVSSCDIQLQGLRSDYFALLKPLKCKNYPIIGAMERAG
jgi:hypothetical protein